MATTASSGLLKPRINIAGTAIYVDGLDVAAPSQLIMTWLNTAKIATGFVANMGAKELMGTTASLRLAEPWINTAKLATSTTAATTIGSKYPTIYVTMECEWN